MKSCSAFLRWFLFRDAGSYFWCVWLSQQSLRIKPRFWEKLQQRLIRASHVGRVHRKTASAFKRYHKASSAKTCEKKNAWTLSEVCSRPLAVKIHSPLRYLKAGHLQQFCMLYKVTNAGSVQRIFSTLLMYAKFVTLFWFELYRLRGVYTVCQFMQLFVKSCHFSVKHVCRSACINASLCLKKCCSLSFLPYMCSWHGFLFFPRSHIYYKMRCSFAEF